MLGVSLASCKKVLVGGVGKGEQKGYQTTLEIEVPDCKTSFISPVIFANLPADMLLGQDAFFEHFHILFEGNVKKFKLNRITRIKNVQ